MGFKKRFWGVYRSGNPRPTLTGQWTKRRNAVPAGHDAEDENEDEEEDEDD